MKQFTGRQCRQRIVRVGSRTAMIAVRSAPPKHVSYTQDSCRRCCAAEGLPGRANFGRSGVPCSRRLRTIVDLKNHRSVQGGVGCRAFAEATSSGHTTAFFPSCHWMVTALWATWNPRPSTAKSPRTVLVLRARSASRSLSESRLPAALTTSTSSRQPA